MKVGGEDSFIPIAVGVHILISCLRLWQGESIFKAKKKKTHKGGITKRQIILKKENADSEIIALVLKLIRLSFRAVLFCFDPELRSWLCEVITKSL